MPPKRCKVSGVHSSASGCIVSECCVVPSRATMTCLTSHSKVNIELPNFSVCNRSNQFYYFNTCFWRHRLYINILPSNRFQHFPSCFMSFIYFHFLIRWLYCVLGWVQRSRTWFGWISFVVHCVSISYFKRAKGDSFLSFLLTVSEDANSCYNCFQKDFP